VIQVIDTEVIAQHLPRHCEDDADCPGSQRCRDEADQDGPATFQCVDESGPVCSGLGTQSAAFRLNTPGPCEALPLSESGLLLDSARIGPFVADVRYVPASDDGRRPARLLMPVRGDATLHWADVEDDLQATGPV